MRLSEPLTIEFVVTGCLMYGSCRCFCLFLARSSGLVFIDSLGVIVLLVYVNPSEMLIVSCSCSVVKYSSVL
jgi:hypothetical protein